MFNFDFLKKDEAPKMKGISFTNVFTIDYNVSKNVLFDFYKQNSYIKAVINKIAQDVWWHWIELQKKIWNEYETQPIDEINNLLSYRWQKQTIKQFISRIQRDVEICWNAYIYLAKNESEEIIGIQNVDPRYIVPVVKDTGELLWYVQNLNWIRVFTPDEMFHYMEEVAIDDETQWQSKMISLFVDLESDKEASESNLAFFKNNQTPSSLIVVDDNFQLDESVETLNTIKEIFNSWKYVWGKNHHRAWLIQGIKEVIKVQDKIDDGQFIQLRRLTMQLVCAVYWVPPDLIWFTETSNRSVWDIQYDIYLNSINAKEIALQEFLNLVITQIDEDYRLVFLQDNLRQLEKKSKIAKELYKESRIITLNEAREIVQYDEVENGEVFFTWIEKDFEKEKTDVE